MLIARKSTKMQILKFFWAFQHDITQISSVGFPVWSYQSNVSYTEKAFGFHIHQKWSFFLNQDRPKMPKSAINKIFCRTSKSLPPRTTALISSIGTSIDNFPLWHQYWAIRHLFGFTHRNFYWVNCRNVTLVIIICDSRSQSSSKAVRRISSLEMVIWL